MYAERFRWLTRITTATTVTGMPAEISRFLSERQGPPRHTLTRDAHRAVAEWTSASGARARAVVHMAAGYTPNKIVMVSSTVGGELRAYPEQKIERDYRGM